MQELARTLEAECGLALDQSIVLACAMMDRFGESMWVDALDDDGDDDDDDGSASAGAGAGAGGGVGSGSGSGSGSGNSSGSGGSGDGGSNLSLAHPINRGAVESMLEAFGKEDGMSVRTAAALVNLSKRARRRAAAAAAAAEHDQHGIGIDRMMSRRGSLLG